MKNKKQELISKALQSKIPAEQWMIESRLESAADAEAYGNSIGCGLHTGLASENRSDAEKLKNLSLRQSDLANNQRCHGEANKQSTT